MLRSLLAKFWKDEAGVVMSAEMVMLGTVGVVGATVGLKTLSSSVDGEFKDVARAIRSLDQSYYYEGSASRTAWVAGSSYIQKPVKDSLAELETVTVEPGKGTDKGRVRQGLKTTPDSRAIAPRKEGDSSPRKIERKTERERRPDRPGPRRPNRPKTSETGEVTSQDRDDKSL